jgi:hypothetical protein
VFDELPPAPEGSHAEGQHQEASDQKRQRQPWMNLGGADRKSEDEHGKAEVRPPLATQVA